MKKTEEVLDAMIANQQSLELDNAVAKLRKAGQSPELVAYADIVSADVREQLRDLICKHPEAHRAILVVLRTALDMIREDRQALAKFSDLRTLPTISELDLFEGGCPSFS